MHRSRRLRTTAAMGLMAACLVFGLSSDGPVTASVRPRPSGPAAPAPPTGRPAAEPEWITVADRGAIAPEPLPDARWIRLSNGIEFDTRGGDPDLPATLRRTGEPDGAGYYIIQFAGPIEEAWKQDIEALGGRFFTYIPNYAFVVKMPGAAAAEAAALGSVTWVGPYHPAYKLSDAEEMSPGRPAGIYTLMLFEGESSAAASAAITAAGGEILETSSGRNQFIRFRADSNGLSGIAADATVAWIEPWQPMSFENSSAQWVVQTWTNGSRRIWDMGIHGEGQIVSTADTGIRTTHNQFKDSAVTISDFGHYPTHRKIIGYVKTVESSVITFGDESLNSYHGTHTGCTIAGDDSPFAADARDGMALQAKIFFCDGGGESEEGVFLPIDLNDLFILPYTGNAGGAARIMSNSWGSPVAGDYDIESMAVDQFMWDHKDFLLFFSNGNSGGLGQVGSPATAKSCVSVGGTKNGTSANQLYSLSSGGPADDGRTKPTLCAPAQFVLSADGSGDTGYVSMSGTSMASPGAAGATTLMRQYLMEGWYPTGAEVPANGFTPSAALLKAMAVNSADPDVTGYTIPSVKIGWGRIDCDKVLFFAGDARKTALVDYAGGLLTGEYIEYQIQVVDNSIPLKATLVWTDYPSTPEAAVNLVNDLNLTATDPSSTVYLGNVYASGQSSTGGTADIKNVEENVQRNTPATGTWVFRVSAANCPYGPQPFALVITGGLAGGFAIVELDKLTYGAGDTLQIRVTDVNGSLPLSASVTSPTETTPESVSLSGGNGIFTGSIPISLDSPVSDGEIQVSDGDLVTVTYNDVAKVGTVSAQALVNITGPMITDVHAGGVDAAAVTVTWLTSSLADSRVYYGATPALGQSTPLNATLVTGHSMVVGDLDTNQTYYFDVESYDNQGNGVRDDNAGQHYTFTTDPRKDVLLVVGDASFTKKDYYDNALSAMGWLYSTWEGLLAEPPLLGDLDAGLRSFKAVLWQPGYEQYPPVTDAARDTLTAFNNGGARWAIFSQDVAWALSDASSPYYTAARKAWFESELKAVWQEDPTTFSLVTGYAGDPISGAYTAGISYTPIRDGGAGDEINPNSVGGTSTASWLDNDTTADDIAVRFTSTGALGNPADAVWGGQQTKLSANFYEWTQINAASATDATRADVLDKTIIWLVGHDHPDVTVSAPDGGESFVSGPVSISWTESADTGRTIASRAIYYSANGGESWTLITSAPGASPYSWDITGLPNGSGYRVRVSLLDDGSPVLGGRDDSDGDFTINVPGGDVLGPVVVAGSIGSVPNPIRAAEPMSLDASVSDANSGSSNVTAAEWSAGPSPASAGTGTAMSGAFGSVTVAVTAAIPAGTFSAPEETLWVRGQDSAGAWGNASRLVVKVNGVAVGVTGGLPGARFGLAQNAPNPFNPLTTIQYTLEAPADVRLAVFDVTGREVRLLVDGRRGAGEHAAVWDGRDRSGARVGSGIYFYKIDAAGRTAVRKMVLLK